MPLALRDSDWATLPGTAATSLRRVRRHSVALGAQQTLGDAVAGGGISEPYPRTVIAPQHRVEIARKRAQ